MLFALFPGVVRVGVRVIADTRSEFFVYCGRGPSGGLKVRNYVDQELIKIHVLVFFRHFGQNVADTRGNVFRKPFAILVAQRGCFRSLCNLS